MVMVTSFVLEFWSGNYGRAFNEDDVRVGCVSGSNVQRRGTVGVVGRAGLRVTDQSSSWFSEKLPYGVD